VSIVGIITVVLPFASTKLNIGLRVHTGFLCIFCVNKRCTCRCSRNNSCNFHQWVLGYRTKLVWKSIAIFKGWISHKI